MVANMPKYRRILLKLSGEVLQGKKDFGIDDKTLIDLCAQIAEIKKLGVQIGIVIGGGNFWRYRDHKNAGYDRAKSDYMGILATVMDGLAMKMTFDRMKAKSEVISAFPCPALIKTYSSKLGKKLLEQGNIVILAGGTGKPFCTTDTAAAMRAKELGCDVLLKATKVDFVYDRDPKKFRSAKKFTHMTYDEVIKLGEGVMDLATARICKQAKIPILVFNVKKRGTIEKAVSGQTVGTLIYAARTSH